MHEYKFGEGLIYHKDNCKCQRCKRLREWKEYKQEEEEAKADLRRKYGE